MVTGSEHDGKLGDFLNLLDPRGFFNCFIFLLLSNEIYGLVIESSHSNSFVDTKKQHATFVVEFRFRPLQEEMIVID